jgi:putative SOS response-associated peptidase YedK
MCGRITRTSPREAIAKEFGVTRFAEINWHSRYNVAPSQIVETIISIDEGAWADAPGPRLAHLQGAAACAVQRQGRDLAQLSATHLFGYCS